MTSPPRRGFFIEQIAVEGASLPNAEVDFIDGLTVIAGASETGKSYVCGLIDFAFGAKDAPRKIEAAKGYELVKLRLRSRRDGRAIEIERRLTGGNVNVRGFDASGAKTSDRVANARHIADDDTTLSAILLALAELQPTKIRKNAKGETRSLSFRDIAFLTIVDETRIISENPPHLSDPGPLRTAESEVLRLMVTGVASAPPIPLPKVTAGNARAQLALVEEMIERAEADLLKLKVVPEAISMELAAIDKSRASVLASYEDARLEMSKAEEHRATLTRQLRIVESRLVTNETLLRRFELLERHYASDIDRLNATKEASALLDVMPRDACPVCGALPDAHRPDEVASHFSLEELHASAIAEIAKIDALRADLVSVTAGLQAEVAASTAERNALREEVLVAEKRIGNDLTPRVRASAADLEAERVKRDALLHAQNILDQLASLRGTEAPLRLRAKAPKGATAATAKPSTAEMEDFASSIANVLERWHFPELGRVIWSDEKQDLVINKQDRASHGKGVRALTCAAFLCGLLRHCDTKKLAHPGLVVLDSPLVAYKDPDKAGGDSAKLRQAGVKEAFYADLAGWDGIGQLIVFENEDPPNNLANKIRHHHFTKNDTGRYGFFPRI